MANNARECLESRQSESRGWSEEVMAIARAITDQQRGLGLGCGLASLA